MKIKLACAAAVLSLTCTQQAWAHHSFAMYDNTKEVTLHGVIKDYQWTNPHTWIDLDVKDPATGQDVDWSIEGGSVSSLMRMGWKHGSLKLGDTCDIIVHPLKDGTTGGSLMRAIVNGQPVGNPNNS